MLSHQVLLLESILFDFYSNFKKHHSWGSHTHTPWPISMFYAIIHTPMDRTQQGAVFETRANVIGWILTKLHKFEKFEKFENYGHFSTFQTLTPSGHVVSCSNELKLCPQLRHYSTSVMAQTDVRQLLSFGLQKLCDFSLFLHFLVKNDQKT